MDLSSSPIQYSELFGMVDKDEDEMISVKEVNESLDMINVSIDENIVSRALQYCKIIGDDTFNFEQYSNWYGCRTSERNV